MQISWDLKTINSIGKEILLKHKTINYALNLNKYKSSPMQHIGRNGTKMGENINVQYIFVC